ncbi:hypothetical protein BC938DRAFT_480211 [Jimgerdemannia flammicorona]|uniref:Uncharacterized protein n=1 Tax=Jimgerdemannia flammicorona TaxID=994334 RepID=A0A433QJ26_9FUNG|nr:hypothetical protein BC938DRAFT_480211 [Jimgerdemannia flammicorona]
MLPVMDFYRSTDPEEWTSIRIAEHNHAKPEKKGLKLVLDGIKKDLEVVAASNGFDMQRRNKAQQIVNEWKAEQQVLVTGNTIVKMDVIQKKIANASRPTIRKHIQDEKAKTEDKGDKKQQPLAKKVRLDIDVARSIDTSDANSDKEGDRRHVTICKEQPKKVGIKLNNL